MDYAQRARHLSPAARHDAFAAYLGFVREQRARRRRQGGLPSAPVDTL